MPFEHEVLAEGVELYLGDCLEILPTLETGSGDFCFTDPPYNVKKDYGTYQDNLSDEDYLDWSKNFIDEITRVTRYACIYTPTKYKREYWWMLGPKYREIILTYSPIGTFRWGFINQFSSLLTNAKPLMKIKNVWHNTQMVGLGYFFREDNFGHPGYTSEDITNRVMQAFTKEGETVLDCFMGTGTTGKICAKTNRRFVGIEIDPQYYAIARKRITDALKQPLLMS